MHLEVVGLTGETEDFTPFKALLGFFIRKTSLETEVQIFCALHGGLTLFFFLRYIDPTIAMVTGFCNENRAGLKHREEKAWSMKLLKKPAVFAANTRIRRSGKMLLVKYLCAKENPETLWTGMCGSK